MASIEHPGAGPLSGVPLREKFRHIHHGPSRMNGPFRGSSLVERMCESQCDAGSISGRVDLVLVKHTPVGYRSGRTSGIDKGDRPVSFMFLPAGCTRQVLNKVPAVWCACFDGGTIGDFLEIFRDQARGPCVIADFSLWERACGANVEFDPVPRGFVRGVQDHAPARD